MQTINEFIELKAYGTSEGVKKEWDARGRGQQTAYVSKGMPDIVRQTMLHRKHKGGLKDLDPTDIREYWGDVKDHVATGNYKKATSAVMKLVGEVEDWYDHPSGMLRIGADVIGAASIIQQLAKHFLGGAAPAFHQFMLAAAPHVTQIMHSLVQATMFPVGMFGAAENFDLHIPPPPKRKK